MLFIYSRFKNYATSQVELIILDTKYDWRIQQILVDPFNVDNRIAHNNINHTRDSFQQKTNYCFIRKKSRECRQLSSKGWQEETEV